MVRYCFSSSSHEESSIEEVSINTADAQVQTSKERISFSSLFPTMKDVYGTELKSPERADMFLYKKYKIKTQFIDVN